MSVDYMGNIIVFLINMDFLILICYVTLLPLDLLVLSLGILRWEGVTLIEISLM